MVLTIIFLTLFLIIPRGIRKAGINEISKSKRIRRGILLIAISKIIMAFLLAQIAFIWVSDENQKMVIYASIALVFLLMVKDRKYIFFNEKKSFKTKKPLSAH